MTDVATTSSTKRTAGDSRDETSIESLFHFSRITSGRINPLFYVYFPFGVVLAVLRLFIGLHVFILSFILRHCTVGRYILRVMCMILGIVVVEEGVHRPCSVIVSNHVSRFDRYAVALSRSCVLSTSWEMPDFLQRIFGLFALGSRGSRDNIVKHAKRYCSSERASSQPLLVFPESAMTNGKMGLLKFITWPFALDTTIQPLFIEVSRPEFADIAPTVAGSSSLADTFWFLYVPYTVFYLRWLPEVKINKSETPDEFSQRVAASVAERTKLKCTNFTSHDASEFIKRHKFDRSNRAGSCRAPHPYDHLAAKVKEIVPQVPLNAIIKDLERTNGSVDVTIANILEGRVAYNPEPIPAQTNQKTLSKVSINDPSAWRDLFDMRKKEMLDTQRRKYIERKGYNLRQRTTD